MPSVRETYDLPEDAPTPIRLWVAMVVFAAVSLLVWLVLPHTPVVVGVLVLLLLAIAFLLVQIVLSSRELEEPPGRNPTTPPSAKSG
jgi:hypothetical protein